MQASRIANYKVIKGTFPELAEEAKGGMLETFKTQPRLRPLWTRRHRRRYLRVDQPVGDERPGRRGDAPRRYPDPRAPR